MVARVRYFSNPREHWAVSKTKKPPGEVILRARTYVGTGKL